MSPRETILIRGESLLDVLTSTKPTSRAIRSTSSSCAGLANECIRQIASDSIPLAQSSTNGSRIEPRLGRPQHASRRVDPLVDLDDTLEERLGLSDRQIE